MASQILILQSDLEDARILADYFKAEGHEVWETSDAHEARTLLKKHHPPLAFIDLHLPGNEWIEVLSCVLQDSPVTRVVITNKQPDVRREMLAKEQGFEIFLRQPFTPQWVDAAIKKLEAAPPPYVPTAAVQEPLPRVRLPIRLKITFPFALLAILFAIAAAYLGSRFIVESIRERFTIQLFDAAKLSADAMVQEENRILENLRVLANTEGVAASIQAGNAERLRQIALPIAINYQKEAVEVLDLQGVSVLSLHHRVGAPPEEYSSAQGDTTLAELAFIQKILQKQSDEGRDKYASVVHAPWGNYFYIAGPVFDAQGELSGVVVVGTSLYSLARKISNDTLAHIIFYDPQGNILESTYPITEGILPVSPEMAKEILERQDQESRMRDLNVAGKTYSEVLGAWEARGGEDLGVIGASLAQNFIIQPKLVTRFQAFFLVALAFVGVIFVGIYIAQQLTTPLKTVVKASMDVAQGNLEVKVPTAGNDEVAVLAHAFNKMVSGLQEGFIYRDLLGRTVSPEVREALRRSFASGDLRLEGQNTVATVMMSDVRGFTTLSEKEEPTTILTWLNEYFGELVPIVTAHGGVVDKFEGDAMLAFFGILPTPLPPDESSYQGCAAAVELLEVIERINARRAGRNEPPLITGIGLNTGKLTAGGLGTADRLNYTIIGDTVNTTQRIQDSTREFGESGIAISESTLDALGDRKEEFRFEPLGEHSLRGKAAALLLYRLRSMNDGQTVDES